MNRKNILFVVTSHDRMGTFERKTGLWLEEFAEPYRILSGEGANITVASPKGGRIPLDPESLKQENASADVLAFFNRNQTLFEQSVPLGNVDPEKFDAVFYPGGHGPVWDLTCSEINARLLEQFFRDGKMIAAVCHGPAALLSARKEDGASILAGRRVTGFSNAEEKLAGLDHVVPFSLEDRLRTESGNYVCQPPWSEFVVADGNLITGQNPQSSKAIAGRLASVLR